MKEMHGVIAALCAVIAMAVIVFIAYGVLWYKPV